MLSKSKKIMMVFISVILSLLILISPCLVASANDLTEADANSNSNSLSNASSVFSSASDQEIINDIVDLLEASFPPKGAAQKAVSWATNQFLSKVLHIETADQNFNKTVLSKLDDLMAGQTMLQKSMEKLSDQVERGELAKFLNDFGEFINENKATKIYNTLLFIDENQKNGTYSEKQAAASRLQTLTTNRGLTMETMGSTDTDIDNYTEKLYSALTRKMKVAYKDGVNSDDDIFEINYQYL